MDIYFTEEYGKLCQQIEDGVCETFYYQSDLGSVHHMFIKKQIPQRINNKQYYDLITPYGYGGPLVVLSNNSSAKDLCREFEHAFSEYCSEHSIVSEFVRFHPIMQNAKDFQEIYHPSCIRKTLGTNLEDYEDPVQSEFSKGCRKNIRQALKKGVTYRITESPDNIDAFLEIYYSTMKRDNAADFYYFDKKYFDSAIRLLKDSILFVEAIFEKKTIAAGMYFISDGVIHIHLSGTLSEYLYLSPAYMLRYAVALWGKEHGYQLIHHGGGTSNEPDNSLFVFKKQFAKNTEFDFCIGKKIWNKEIYELLCAQTKQGANNDFFPAYRKR